MSNRLFRLQSRPLFSHFSVHLFSSLTLGSDLVTASFFPCPGYTRFFPPSSLYTCSSFLLVWQNSYKGIRTALAPRLDRVISSPQSPSHSTCHHLLTCSPPPTPFPRLWTSLITLTLQLGLRVLSKSFLISCIACQKDSLVGYWITGFPKPWALKQRERRNCGWVERWQQLGGRTCIQ